MLVWCERLPREESLKAAVGVQCVPVLPQVPLSSMAANRSLTVAARQSDIEPRP
jgi:hypothetical protein